MTAEREAMTLEQLQNKLLEAGASGGMVLRPKECRDFANAIDAHLSRAAEPVYQRDIGTDIECWVDLTKDKYDELQPAFGALTRILYTHPPEPARDAKDAARLDAIDKRPASGRRVEFAKSLFSPGVEIGLHEPIQAFARGSAREAIQAAMQANPDAKEGK